MRKPGVFKLLAVMGAVSVLSTGIVTGLSAYQADSCNEPTSIYTVQPDDRLYEIGIMYGDIRFWESIYIANADLIDDPDLIYAGQQFEIPYAVYSYESFDVTLESVLSNPFCDTGSLPIASIDFSRLALYSMNHFDLRRPSDEQSAGIDDQLGDATDRLAEFRKAFNAVTESTAKDSEQRTLVEESDAISTQKDSVQQQSERRILMEIDGMVLDETRSKVGRDFYDVFYTNWQQPPDTHNFSIRIAEQLSPSLGTIIYVEVNDTETFRMRLQPRYDFIQQAGRYAVSQTYSYLQNNDHRLQIY